MSKPYVLIKFEILDGYQTYLVPYDKELFNIIDNRDEEYEYHYWTKNACEYGCVLSLGKEIDNIKIVMVRTLSGCYGPLERNIEEI